MHDEMPDRRSIVVLIQVDAIVQDQMVFDLDVVTGDDFLRFAGLEPLSLKVPVKE